MEIEESEFCELIDYTNVNDWEKFISEVEEVICSLEHSKLNDKCETRKVQFQKFELNIGVLQPNILNLENLKIFDNELNSIETSESLVCYENKNELSDSDNDMQWELIKWFGRKKFIVLTPSRGISIYAEDQINQLIGSLTVAAINIKCQLPIVVKYGSRNWSLYQGLQFENDFKSKLQCATIKYTPKQCMYLSGLRRLFQEKLGLGYVLNDDIIMTAKYLYIIENCFHKNEYYFKGIISPMNKKMHFFQYLSVGFAKDPVKNTKIFAHWSQIPKHILIHSECESLAVSSANCWYIICESENSYDGVLYRTLRKLLKSFLVAQKSSEILQEMKPQDIDTMHINQPLLKLTAAPISNHTLLKSSFEYNSKLEKIRYQRQVVNSQFLDEKILNDILFFIFPDTRPTSINSQSYIVNDNLSLKNYKKLMKRYSNANKNSFVHRLAICLTNLLSSHKEGMKCFSYIWMKVILELRYRWDNGIPLPDTHMEEDFKSINGKTSENKDEIFSRLLNDSVPHLGSSQLEQRLQLINYCILTKLRNQDLQRCDTDENVQVTDNSDSEDISDQFFDCMNDDDTAATIGSNNMNAPTRDPRGRLRKCGDLKLINFPDIHLYVPITQVQSVNIYTKGGEQTKHNEEYSDNCHTASLISDMSAFQSANPGCIIEDFIRWYSPKDFVEADTENCTDSVDMANSVVKGELSFRMLKADNTWLSCWKKAVPVPVRLQKRLFDETVAVENALKWMQNLTAAEISSNLINNVLIDSLSALAECIDEQDPPELLEQLESASLAIMAFFDSTDIMDVSGAELEYYQNYDELISHIQKIEYSLTIKKSLSHKFLRGFSGSDCNRNQIIALINKLLTSNCEIALRKENLSKSSYDHIFQILESMYQATKSFEHQENSVGNIDQTFANANQKEYVLSLNCSYPSPSCRKSNQRLYVCSNDEEFLIATNFCEDLTYF